MPYGTCPVATTSAAGPQCPIWSSKKIGILTLLDENLMTFIEIEQGARRDCYDEPDSRIEGMKRVWHRERALSFHGWDTTYNKARHVSLADSR